jgi:predicted flap endonuclease-1-like 5' DNA nuclease
VLYMFQEIWLPLLLAFAIGVWPIGWWIWGGGGNSKKKVADLEADLVMARRNADDAAAGRTRLEKEIAELRAKGPAPAAVGDSDEVARLKSELDKARTEAATCHVNLDQANAEIAKLKAAPAVDLAAAPAPVAAFAAVPAAAAADDSWPTFLSAPRGQADDLRLIKGVGEKLNTLLNSLGVFHFKQIAAWSEAQVAEVDGKLANFKGRIARDKWQEQAGLLADGKIVEFNAKFGQVGSEIKNKG